MNEEPKYKIGKGEQPLGEYDKWELMRIYNGPHKCTDIWIEKDGQRGPLWSAISWWHGGRPLEDVLVPMEGPRRVPLLNIKANANEKPKPAT